MWLDNPAYLHCSQHWLTASGLHTAITSGKASGIQGHIRGVDAFGCHWGLCAGLPVWRTLALLATPTCSQIMKCFLSFISLLGTPAGRALEEVPGWVPRGAENLKIGRRQGAWIASALQGTPVTRGPRHWYTSENAYPHTSSSRVSPGLGIR